MSGWKRVVPVRSPSRMLNGGPRSRVSRALTLLVVAVSALASPLLGSAPAAVAGFATFGAPQKQDTSSLGTPAPAIKSLTFDNNVGLAGTASLLFNNSPATSAVWTNGGPFTALPQANAVGSSLTAGAGSPVFYHSFVGGGGGNIYYRSGSTSAIGPATGWQPIANIADTRAAVASFNAMSCDAGLTDIFNSCTIVGTNGNVWSEFEDNSIVTFHKQTITPATTDALNAVSCAEDSGSSFSCVAVGQNATVVHGVPGTTGGSWSSKPNASGLPNDNWTGVSCVVAGTGISAASACYSVGPNGVYSSGDGGVTWSPLGSASATALTFQPTAVVAVGGSSLATNTIYVAGGTDGLAASNDGGATWTTYHFAQTVLTNPHTLAVRAGNAGLIYVGGDAGSLVALPVTFSTQPAPTVTSIDPRSGPTAGGTTVTINGTNFNTAAGATTVSFGGVAASSVSCATTTQCTAVSPAGGGTVHVTVSTAGGTSAVSAADQFTYVGAPSVTGVNPTQGASSGGSTVVITGSGFTGASAVRFGVAPATSFTVNSDTQITALVPAGSAGSSVDVTVTTAGGTSPVSASDRFAYGPTISTVQSSATSSGATITWTTDAASSTQVEYGQTTAYGSSSALDPTLVTAHSVTLTGLLPNTLYHYRVKSGTNGIVTTSGDFTFTTGVASPTVTGVSPASGPSSGGTVVTIRGTGFSGATAVSFGTTPATSFTVNSDTQITAVSPAGTVGTGVDVTVTTASGTSAINVSDVFAYTSWVYVANQQSNTVSVIDTIGNRVVATVPVGTTPRNLLMSADGSRVLVTNKGSNSVSLIDTSTNTVVGAPITVGGAPDSLILSPDGSTVYVANTTSNTITVIETTTYTVVTTVAVGVNPTGLAVSPDGSMLYVTNQGSNTTSLVDTTLYAVTNIPVGVAPYGVVALR